MDLLAGIVEQPRRLLPQVAGGVVADQVLAEEVDVVLGNEAGPDAGLELVPFILAHVVGERLLAGWKGQHIELAAPVDHHPGDGIGGQRVAGDGLLDGVIADPFRLIVDEADHLDGAVVVDRQAHQRVGVARDTPRCVHTPLDLGALEALEREVGLPGVLPHLGGAVAEQPELAVVGDGVAQIVGIGLGAGEVETVPAGAVFQRAHEPLVGALVIDDEEAVEVGHMARGVGEVGIGDAHEIAGLLDRDEFRQAEGERQDEQRRGHGRHVAHRGRGQGERQGEQRHLDDGDELGAGEYVAVQPVDDHELGAVVVHRHEAGAREQEAGHEADAIGADNLEPVLKHGIGAIAELVHAAGRELAPVAERLEPRATVDGAHVLGVGFRRGLDVAVDQGLGIDRERLALLEAGGERQKHGAIPR